MKRLKIGQIVLIAVVVTLATGLVKSSIQAYDGATRYGIPTDWWRTHTVGEGGADGFVVEPTGLFIDFGLWFALALLLNIFLLKGK